MALSPSETAILGAIAGGAVTGGLALIGVFTTTHTQRQNSSDDRQQRRAEISDTAFSVLTERLQAELARSDLRITQFENVVKNRDTQIAGQDDRIFDLETRVDLRTSQLDRERDRLTAAYDYIAALTQQLRDAGLTPVTPPPELRARK